MCQSNHQLITLKRVTRERKIVFFAVVAVIAATAAVWSISPFARSKVAGPVQATETSAPVSPHEIMVKQGRSLPVEYWAHPF
jgi:hypothetical protein